MMTARDIATALRDAANAIETAEHIEDVTIRNVTPQGDGFARFECQVEWMPGMPVAQHKDSCAGLKSVCCGAKVWVVGWVEPRVYYCDKCNKACQCADE